MSPTFFPSFPTPSHTVKAQIQRLVKPYFRVTISTLCIFYDNCTQNILLESYLFIKVITQWCVHGLEGSGWYSEIWHSENTKSL